MEKVSVDEYLKKPETRSNVVSYQVNVRAHEVRKNDDGTYAIVVEARELTHKEREVLHELFPNLTEKAYELLSKETLLQAIV